MKKHGRDFWFVFAICVLVPPLTVGVGAGIIIGLVKLHRHFNYMPIVLWVALMYLFARGIASQR